VGDDTNPGVVVERYRHVWNLEDSDACRREVESLWARGGRYTDPVSAVAGHEAIVARIAEVHTQFPGMTFIIDSGADAHHRLLRVPWQLRLSGQPPVLTGIDIVVLDTSGRIQDVYGFFDGPKLPERAMIPAEAGCGEAANRPAPPTI
jgi:hypothetical protein